MQNSPLSTFAWPPAGGVKDVIQGRLFPPSNVALPIRLWAACGERECAGGGDGRAGEADGLALHPARMTSIAMHLGEDRGFIRSTRPCRAGAEPDRGCWTSS